MAEKNVSYLADITPDTHVISLKLRVTSKREYPGKKVDRLELVCSDGKQFAKVVTWGKNVKSVEKSVNEGESWLISGLQVQPTPPEYQRSVLVPYDLTIAMGRTSLKKCETIVSPPWPYTEFVNLHQFMDKRVDVKCYVVFVGQEKAVGQRQLTEVTVADTGRNRVILTLWEDQCSMDVSVGDGKVFVDWESDSGPRIALSGAFQGDIEILRVCVAEGAKLEYVIF